MNKKRNCTVQRNRRISVFPFIILFASIFLFTIAQSGNLVQAGSLTPEGKWKTISDVTGKANSIVRIWIEKDKLLGKVEKVIPQEGEDPNPLCQKCEGEKKDQPITGMVILWDLSQQSNEWDGGFILDPDNGKTYRCVVRVVDRGNKLEVRGYIGFSLFGRTQTWERVSDP